MMFRLLSCALLAGAIAGVGAAFLQLCFVQPVLLQAEAYESGRLVHFSADMPYSVPPIPDEISLTRNALTVLFTMLIYAGYAMVLVGLMSLAEERGAPVDARHGVLWGIAGFVTFHLAPGFSLAPELPGAASAAITDRQVWWFATVAMTGIGLWLFAFAKAWLSWGAAAVLILAPHLYGAPLPDAYVSAAPSEVGTLFAARALGVGLVAWVMLGAATGHFWSRRTPSTG